MLGRFPEAGDDVASREQVTPIRYKRERQRLVVHPKEGSTLYGMCFALNRNTPGFHLDLLDKTGAPKNKTEHVVFDSIKAVFFVKSFDGRFDPNAFEPVSVPSSQPIAITFTDGELLIGKPIHSTWKEEARFYVIPEDQDSNNIMVLVERTAVASILNYQDYKRRLHHEFLEFMKTHPHPDLPKEECLGDFYFSRQDYKSALKHYRHVRDLDPASSRILKKLCAAKYNLAMRHIKHKNYTQALRFMEMILAVDPHHEQAVHKAKQLRAYIAKHPNE